MKERPPHLPGLLNDIASVAGKETALAIAAKVGGTRVYFPAEPSENHWLSQLVGREAALRIGQLLTGGFVGGVRIDIPLGPSGHFESVRAKVDRLIAEGCSERDIALATRYTTRGVRKRRAVRRSAVDDPQQDLFKS